MTPLPGYERIIYRGAEFPIDIVAPKTASVRAPVVRKRRRADGQRNLRLAHHARVVDIRV